MDRIKSIEAMRMMIAEVRNKRNGFITNFFFDEYKHNVWIRKGDFFYDYIGETLFLIKISDSFCNLFYNSNSIETLCRDLKGFKLRYPEQTAMIDIIGRESQCQQLITAMQTLDLSEATSLVRMTRTTEPMEYVEDTSVSVASVSEVENVYNLLHQFFDEKTEQIPYIEELLDYSKQGHILVCHEDEQLAGFVIYEKNTTTLYLRYWFVNPNFRGRKVGSRLLRRFFEEGRNTKRQLLWVIRSNEDAIKRYHHYSFKEDDMFDFVLRIN